MPRAAEDSICIAIAADSVQEMLQRSENYLSQFPFQEFRLDFLPDPTAALPTLQDHVAANRTGRFLATCRRLPSGGRFSGSPEEELEVLYRAAVGGCSLVDLSLESAETLGAAAVQHLQSTGAAVLLSWHDFQSTGDLVAVLNRMRAFSPDILKIVPTAKSLLDNLPVLALTARERLVGPTMVLAMGEPGVPSRVLSLRAGSVFTFAAASAEGATAPGQVGAEALHNLYRIESLTEETRIYGVAGDPIRSSLSPLMLNTAFARQSEDAVYLPLLTHNASELFRFARALPLHGFSVTMPLKQAVLPLLDHVSPLAARIGAVNTVRRRADGSLEGFNTDADGIVVPLRQRQELRGARVLVLGAGGAARAAVFACADAGAQVCICSRRPEAAGALAAEACVEAVDRERLGSVPPFDVLINATPAGMRGNTTEMPVEPHELRTTLVFDLVYNPLETPLLRAARDRGLQTISGIEMFVQQGARQFELWTGRSAPVQSMREAVLQALS